MPIGPLADGTAFEEFAGRGVWRFNPVYGWFQFTAANSSAFAVSRDVSRGIHTQKSLRARTSVGHASEDAVVFLEVLDHTGQIVLGGVGQQQEQRV
jgi:hypothetical protein